MRALFCLTLAAFALPWSPVIAQTGPGPSAQIDPAHRASALQLARTVQTRAVAIDEAMVAMDKQFVTAMKANPELAKLEAGNPGLVQAMWDGIRPTLSTALVAKLPELHDLLADIYARRLTPAQLASAQRFFGSATGQKLVLQLARSIDYGAMLGEVARNPGADISQGAYAQSVQPAGARAVTLLTPAEQAEAGRYFTSPHGLALVALEGEVSAAGVAWMNKPDPALEAQIEAKVQAAAELHLKAARR